MASQLETFTALLIDGPHEYSNQLSTMNTCDFPQISNGTGRTELADAMTGYPRLA